jgi:hypothetical protein
MRPMAERGSKPSASATLQAAPGTRRDSLGAFLVAGVAWVADSPKTSQRLLKPFLSHFAYGESGLAFVVWRLGTRADRREARGTKRSCVRSPQRMMFRDPKGPLVP